MNINKSLFTLSSCLNILSEKSNTGKFVPYRDSKLTRLLKDSLGGNILTVMLACISSLSFNYDETLSTLNYAYKAKKITKKVMKNIKEININNLPYKEMIDSLKNEIMQLKNIIKNQEIRLKQKVTITINQENKEKKLDNNKNNNEINININDNKIISNNNELRDNVLIGDDPKSNNQEINLLENNDNNLFNLSHEEINGIHSQKEYLEQNNKYIEELSYDNLDINNLKKMVESLKMIKIY